MKIELVKEKEEKLFNRKEILVKLDFEKNTPSKEVIKKELSDNLKLNPELLTLNKVKQRFGERTADIFAYIYKDAASLKKLEIKNKKQKKNETKKEESKK